MSSPLAPTIPGMAGLPPLSEFPPIGPNYGALLVGTFLSLMYVSFRFGAGAVWY
ncbi:hypothetical protein TRAPUB_8352 [Trametes pubescens]|uniref:Uncharacterized protein n=1 Tax=Trametes pubescens TaxID=154538 RepID=A0A1M2W5F8_TRAPU|nr:hypothetical protein TRAPUB_8352 [Trametes pubescens]